jgi:hypothetical protein
MLHELFQYAKGASVKYLIRTLESFYVHLEQLGTQIAFIAVLAVTKLIVAKQSWKCGMHTHLKALPFVQNVLKRLKEEDVKKPWKL